LIQQREERTERRCPNEREESTDQERAGGACAKMCAARKSDGTQTEFNTRISENSEAKTSALMPGDGGQCV